MRRRLNPHVSGKAGSDVRVYRTAGGGFPCVRDAGSCTAVEPCPDMLFAAAGMITPTAGALIQEAVDLAVIANALRASRDPSGRETPREINFALTDLQPG